MPIFQYRAINENGHSIAGEIEAISLPVANQMLAARGYIPSKVSLQSALSGNVKKIGLLANLQGVPTRDIILFTQQFRTLLRAGVPIVTLLKVLENQTENAKLRVIIDTINQDIRAGSTLNDAFRRHPKVFSVLYCSMIHSGEISGSLPEVLQRLIYILQHEYQIKSDIRSAMQYPAMVLGFLVFAFFALLTFVIPKFVTVFSKAGVELPLPTRICMTMYTAISQYWILLLAGLLLFAMSIWFVLRTEQGKYYRDVVALSLPVIGPLVLKASMSRFASIFSILQSSGVPILTSIDILSGTIGNSAISREFVRLRERLEEGRGISSPLRSGKYFTPMVINMVAIGEESGNLEEMLSEISRHYDVEVEYAMKRLTEAIGPFLVVCLAAVVGFFAMAIFLPMWDMTKIIR